MKNNAYWKERFVQLEQGQFYTAMGEYQHIQRFFNQAQKELQDEIELWYARLANNNGVSMSEAKKLLKGKKLEEFKWTVEQYIQYGQDNAMNGQWLKELENASARYHISHLEALQIQTKQAIEKCYASYGLTATDAIGEAYKSALYKTAYTVQRGFGVGADITGVDQRKLEALLAKPWAVDGKNFSERIWDNKEKLVNELHQSLSRNIMTGGDPKQVIDELAKKMNTSKANAGRLIMTESAYFSSLAEKNELADLGVEEYEIVATLDDRTSDICQGMDGQIFKVKDFQPGVNAPPFHVNCRSTTVPHFSDNFDLGQRAARDKDGNTITVPASMKYPEWKKQFVKEDSAPAVKNIKYDIDLQEIRNATTKLKQSMSEEAYNEYTSLLKNNPLSAKVYVKYADGLNKVTNVRSGGVYDPASRTLKWKFETYEGMNRYSTLAHEYGHYFDEALAKEKLTFSEQEALRNATFMFKRTKASMSDEFLFAVRADKEHLRKVFSKEVKNDFLQHHASAGVQDAIDGLFSNSRINWGHGEGYYNRRYSAIKSMGYEKELKQIYLKMGLDASNQTKVKIICRQYDAASEIWANVMSAVTCGGSELEYIKKYLPNSYETLLKILGGNY